MELPWPLELDQPKEVIKQGINEQLDSLPYVSPGLRLLFVVLALRNRGCAMSGWGSQ